MPDIAIGSIVGSNIANILLIVGRAVCATVAAARGWDTARRQAELRQLSDVLATRHGVLLDMTAWIQRACVMIRVSVSSDSGRQLAAIDEARCASVARAARAAGVTPSSVR